MLERFTQVLVAAQAASGYGNAYDLVDLPTAKAELGIDIIDTDKDDFVARAITQASRSIASYCKRTFQAETVLGTVYPPRDAYPWQVPGGTDPLQLARWPLQFIPPVSLPAPAETDQGNVLPFASTAGVAVGQPVAHAAVLPGATVTAVAPNVSVTLSTNLTGPVKQGDSVGFGIAVWVTDPPGAPRLLAAGTDYQADAALGQLVRLSPYSAYPMPWDPVLTQVAYQGGYTAIPEDVQDAALRLITARYRARGRDPAMKSQDQPGLGHQQYWIGTMPGVRGAFTEEIRGLLGQYRVPTVA